MQIQREVPVQVPHATCRRLQAKRAHVHDNHAHRLCATCSSFLVLLTQIQSCVLMALQFCLQAKSKFRKFYLHIYFKS